MVTPLQQQKWDEMLQYFKKEIPAQSYNMWFTHLKLYSVDGNKVIVNEESGQDIVRNTLHNRYEVQLDAMVKAMFGIEYTFVLRDGRLSQQEEGIAASTLNRKYTFDNFITGDSNNLAYMAALAVAEQPSSSYNPLFIWGDVGLGKTHLMNAIGNYCHDLNPHMRILFTSTETMTNELINTLTKNASMEQFRQKFRNVDLLIIDDVQFLSVTKSTQDEFFNMFNDLMQNGRQIVISSDRPPKEIPTLEDRLRSRFEWGLIVDIQKPNYETRVAILKNKCEVDGVDIPYEVLNYIARSFTDSIRELEGALTRLQAVSRLKNEPITLTMAEEALTNLMRNRGAREITVKRILEQVSDAYGVSVSDILGKKRSSDIANARHVAIYLARTLTDHSTTALGNEFGRDHSTVMTSVKKIETLVETNLSERNRISEIERKIKEM